MNTKENTPDPLYRYFKELGKEKPEIEFHQKVLERIEKRKEIFKYKPVISTLAWKLISVIVTSILILSWFSTNENSLNTSWTNEVRPNVINLFSKINFLSQFPKVEISPVFGITTAAFFLLSLLAFYLNAMKTRRLI